MMIDNVISTDDIITFLSDQYKQTGDINFMVAADNIELYRRDCSLLKFLLNKQNKWINVKDGLPENQQEVIVYRGHHSGLMNVYTYIGNNEWEDDYGYWGRTNDEGITHWMPLPVPPKTEEK